MTIDQLIKNITPLYNGYRSKVSSISGTEALKIMWEIGFYLNKYIEENNIAPHKLFWDIYGRSEGSANSIQKSYITREFQSRSYRIYKIFKDKNDIEIKFFNLKRFNLFREAMPFFDNKKYVLKGRDMDNLISLLNSEYSNSVVLNRIKCLQKNVIGIKNPRTQRLIDERENAICFVNFYNYILNLLNKKDYNIVLTELEDNNINNNIIDFLYKNTAAISQDNLKFSIADINPKEVSSNVCNKYLNFLVKITSLKTKKNIRRFRRIIKPYKIFKLSEMIYALKSKENYYNFINSNGTK